MDTLTNSRLKCDLEATFLIVLNERNDREEAILFRLTVLKKSNNTKKTSFAKHLKTLVVRIYFDSVYF